MSDPPANDATAPRKPTMKETISWAFYDWANTGYAMIVAALIFPRLYESYYAGVLKESGNQTTAFTFTVAIASLLVAVLAPVLGSIGELGGLRKRLLLGFCASGVIATAGIFLVGEDQYWLASLVYIIGTVSFYASNIFYDSMLALVSTREKRHFVSGLGFAFGYSAGFLLLGVIFVVTTFHQKFGLPDVETASRTLFLFAACWWALFTIPLALNIPGKPNPNRPPIGQMAVLGLKDTWATLQEIIHIKPVLWFLAAYLFYIDGLNTIILTAANYGATIGFTELQMNIAFAVVQVFGVPCAILFGWLGGKFGPRRMIFIAIVLYMGVTCYGSIIDTSPKVVFGMQISEIYILAALIGIVQGGTQALSRSYFNSLIPPGREVSFFGFYSMIGKSAAVMGPALMGVVAFIFKDPERPAYATRLGLGSVALLFVIGGILLTVAGRMREEAKVHASQ